LHKIGRYLGILNTFRNFEKIINKIQLRILSILV
jgi:hypothetical protein